MPTVSGTLSDIGLAPLVGVEVELRFTPSAPAVNREGRVFASKPVAVKPFSTGDFSVELAPTEGLVPIGVHWKLAVDFFSTAADKSRVHATDLLDLKIFVPATGGKIGDLIGAKVANDWVYVGPDVPNPDRPEQLQMNSVTGDLYERMG